MLNRGEKLEQGDDGMLTTETRKRFQKETCCMLYPTVKTSKNKRGYSIMARSAKRGKITLSEEEREYLQDIAKSGTARFREVERARIILNHGEGKTDKGIAHEIGTRRFTVRKG